MSKRATRTPEQRELDERIESANERELRLDETLTRREVVEAIEALANEYGCDGNHDSDLISIVFLKLAKALS